MRAREALELINMSANLGMLAGTHFWSSPWLAAPALCSVSEGSSRRLRPPRRVSRLDLARVGLARGLGAPEMLYGLTATSVSVNRDPREVVEDVDPLSRASCNVIAISFFRSRWLARMRRNIPRSDAMSAGFRIVSFMPLFRHCSRSSGCSSIVTAAMYAREFTGPPCLRICRASWYPSMSGRRTPMRMTSNSMFAHAAAA